MIFGKSIWKIYNILKVALHKKYYWLIGNDFPWVHTTLALLFFPFSEFSNLAACYFWLEATIYIWKQSITK